MFAVRCLKVFIIKAASLDMKYAVHNGATSNRSLFSLSVLDQFKVLVPCRSKYKTIWN